MFRPDPNVRILSVRQPWAWLIVNGHKDIENRTQMISHRGQVLIHAALYRSTPPHYESIRQRAHDLGVSLPAANELKYGGIIGLTNIVGCLTYSESPWFDGPIGWQLDNSSPLPFVREKGMLSLFRPSADLLTRLSTATSSD